MLQLIAWSVPRRHRWGLGEAAGQAAHDLIGSVLERCWAQGEACGSLWDSCVAASSLSVGSFAIGKWRVVHDAIVYACASRWPGVASASGLRVALHDAGRAMDRGDAASYLATVRVLAGLLRPHDVGLSERVVRASVACLCLWDWR